ncbi:MAG: hypothetical protein NPIRA03_13170 [Nitrospirales bacterium]|nr:MAG: hypothetical protein NPIRA03_13170 [Nitrospirales bacterium]
MIDCTRDSHPEIAVLPFGKDKLTSVVIGSQLAGNVYANLTKEKGYEFHDNGFTKIECVVRDPERIGLGTSFCGECARCEFPITDS